MIQKLGLMGRFRSGLRVLFGREPILRTGRVRKELPCFRSRLRVCVPVYIEIDCLPLFTRRLGRSWGRLEGVLEATLSQGEPR